MQRTGCSVRKREMGVRSKLRMMAVMHEGMKEIRRSVTYLPRPGG